MVCTTPSVVFICYKKKDKWKGKSARNTESTLSSAVFSNTHKSGELSSKSTQADRGSSVQNNTYQLVVTQSTQDDSTLSRGRGTSIYEKMTKEQMLRAGRTQFNKLSSDTQRKSIRLGRPAQSVILSKRKFQQYMLRKSQPSSMSLSERTMDQGAQTPSSREATLTDNAEMEKFA